MKKENLVHLIFALLFIIVAFVIDRFWGDDALGGLYIGAFFGVVWMGLAAVLNED